MSNQLMGGFKAEHKCAALKTTWSVLSLVCPLQKFLISNVRGIFWEKIPLIMPNLNFEPNLKTFSKNNQLASTTVGNSGISPLKKVLLVPTHLRLSGKGENLY